MAYYTGENGKLVPYSGEIPQEAIAAIEAADEQTIVERLTRLDAQSVFAYSYPVKTKDGVKNIIGISADGAKELANLLGNIRVSSEIKVEEKDDYFYAIVPVTNLIRNVTLVGPGAQSKYILGEGNEPTDRIDVLAFVKAITKAQRNGILSIAPQGTIAEIISKLDVRAIKKLPAPPSYGKPALKEGTTAKVGTTDALKKLRQQVGIEAGKVFASDDERKAWQKEKYGVDSMTELDGEQLKEMFALVKEMQKPAKVGITDLGFSSEAEQTQMRKQLFALIDEIGYKTDEEKRKYVAEKNWRRTTEATKDELESYIEEVNRDKKDIDEARALFSDTI